MVATTLLLPWILGSSVKTATPAGDLGRFFGDSFERRTGAAAAGRRRRSRYRDAGGADRTGPAASPARRHAERTPWQSGQRFTETGGVVVWRAQDTAGAPPEHLRQRFPDLVAEVPRVFERMIQGREPLARIGWAIVRPKGR